MVATTLILALGRKKQVDLCTKTAWSVEIVQGQPGLWRNLVSKKQNYNPPRMDQNWTKVKAGIEGESITGKSACPGRCLAARGQSLIISHRQLRH